MTASAAWSPVLPERTSLEWLRSTSEHQASGILIGAACPTCGCGIVSWGESLCARCMSEAHEDRVDVDCDARARLAGGRRLHVLHAEHREWLRRVGMAGDPGADAPRFDAPEGMLP